MFLNSSVLDPTPPTAVVRRTSKAGYQTARTIDPRRKSHDLRPTDSRSVPRPAHIPQSRLWGARKTEAVIPKMDEMSAIFGNGMGAAPTEKHMPGKRTPKLGQSGMRTDRNKFAKTDTIAAKDQGNQQ